MKKFTLLLLFVLPIFVSKIYAVPAYPYPIDITQPDGSVLSIKLHGDEFFSYTTTSDGYLLTQNKQGFYEYAHFIKGKIVSTGVTANNNRTEDELLFLTTLDNTMPINQEDIDSLVNNSIYKSPSQQRLAPNPLFGVKKGIVILVNFTDKSFQNPKVNFENLLNQPGYNKNGGTGSAKEYFEASSFNQFLPEFDVYGPYTLSKNMAYYGAHVGSQNDAKPGEMVIEACQLALADGVDFSQYDTDNDGYVDQVFVYYAGNNEAEGGDPNTIWPHRSVVYSNLDFSGKLLRDYACSSEMRGTGNTMCGIGTFCHEFSHVLGLPDFYNVDHNGQSGYYTVGAWDLMSDGGYNNNGNTPPTYSAHERFFLSYMKSPDIQVLSTRGRYELEPLVTTNKAYLISSDDVSFWHNLNGTAPNPTEYFLLENRQAVGWDSIGLPATGMLIVRVQFSSGRWSNNTVNNDQNNLLYDIMEADGIASYSTYSGDPFPGSTNRRDFSPILKNGTHLDAELTLIQEDEFGIIKFAFRGGAPDDPYIDVVGQNKLLKTVVGTPSDSLIFHLSGGNLTQNIVLSFSDSKYFEMKLDGTNLWTTTLTLQPEIDSTLSAIVNIRYNPTVASYNNIHSTLLKIIGEVTKSITIQGQSKRQIFITVPEALDATNVSPYSFQANWTPVYDPVYVAYYLSVYTKNGETTDTEDFTNFNNVIPFGWQSTFKTITTITPASSPCAIVFKTAQDTLWTPYYPMPVEKIKFWARSEDSNQDGFFEIYGYNENGWNVISTIPVNRNLTAQVKEITLNAADNYNQFKFACNGISSKGMAFDDFAATYKASYIVNKQMVNEADSFRVYPLDPNITYYYKVQATDQDPKGRYENITDFSNEILIKTPYGEPIDSRKLTVSVDDLGNVIISINDPDIRDNKGNPLDLYVFNLTGQLVRRIPYSSFANNPGQVIISGLTPHNTYVISLGAKRKGKYAKVFIK